MQDRAQQLLAVTITFLVLAWVSVSLRCFVRLKIVKAFGLDDYLIVVSLVSNHFPRRDITPLTSHSQLAFTAFCGCQITGIHYGMGSHNADLTTPNIIQALKVRP